MPKKAPPKTFRIKTNELAISPHGFVIINEALSKIIGKIDVGNIPILGATNNGCQNGDCRGGDDTNIDCTNTKC